MKEKELFVDFKPQQVVLYVEKEDGSYGQVVTGSFLAKNYLDDYFDKVGKWDKSLKEQLKNGEISPVYYYLIMQEFGEKDLASRVGISVRKLRKHYKPEHFVKMRLSLLKRYADVFDIPVSGMFHFLVIGEKAAENLSVENLESRNPYFTITKIEKLKKASQDKSKKGKTND